MRVMIELDELSIITKRRLAEETHSSDVLEVLAHNAVGDAIKEIIANNPYCNSHTLKLLSIEPFWRIRYGVAKNPATPAHILEEIFNDCKRKIEDLKNNPNPADRAYEIEAEENVLDALLINSKTSPELTAKVNELLF